MKTYFITGVAGFIGFHLSKALLDNNSLIVGIDNLNDYYDVSLKKLRLKELQKYDNFIFIKGDITDRDIINDIFKKYNPDIVISLAAQAGVRYSIINPDSYINSNIIGFYNILEVCKNYKIEKLIYASSSSVYGNNSDASYSEESNTDKPISLYAVTKKCDELLAAYYSDMYKIPTIGLRFFSVYGPYGRPDMAYFSFTKKLINNEIIDLYNYGKNQRDYTYIDDVINCILNIIDKKTDQINQIYNVGNSKKVSTLDLINILTKELIREKLLPKNYDIKPYVNMIESQKGDVLSTLSDTTKFEKDFGYKPNTSLETGLHNFIAWYNETYMNNN